MMINGEKEKIAPYAHQQWVSFPIMAAQMASQKTGFASARVVIRPAPSFDLASRPSVTV